MQPRVVGVGDQPLDRPALDPLGRPGTCRAHLRELRLCLRHFYLRSVGCVWHPRTGDLAHRDQRNSVICFSGRRFHSEVSVDPSMRSGTVLAAPSLAGGLQYRPCLLKRFGVGVGHLGHASPLCLQFGGRRFRRHDLSQITQDRMGGRRCFLVSRRPCAHHIGAQKLRRTPNQRTVQS